MRRPRRYSVIAGLALAAALGAGMDRLTHSVVRAQQQSQPTGPIPHGQDQAPNPPRGAAEAAGAMTVPPGFQVEVVAAEPDIVNPVAMTFDERGRIWITESLEYPRRQAGPGRDRIKIIEDTDGDGKADRFKVFADGLNIPSGIAVGHGGVWVANSPDILFLQDRDGDGKADRKEVVVTGFGRSDTHELPNSLTWGPDGWLYGWNGVFNPGKVVSRNGKTYQFTCAIFRIHPKTRVFEVWCEGTSNPWGIAIDPEGSFFASACVIDHLWHLVETGYYIRQGGPYPPFTWPIESIVDHSHQKAAYCGIHYFDSPAYPPEFRGRLYMGNIHGNGVNVDVLERTGSTYRGKTAPDFLRANDAWFMPVSQKTGPDGCLYVLDWYDRYHCYQDANRDPAGIDRLKGRLYRVRYQETPRRAGFDLSKTGDDELLNLLGSLNVYDREMAQRILTERGSVSISGKLETLVLDEKKPRPARMHALWARVGIGPLEPDFHARLLSHNDATFRAWGVRAVGNMGKVDAKVRDQVIKLAHDSSPDVRLQVAIAAMKIEGVDPLQMLLNVEQRSYEDPLIPQIIWQNLHPMLKERQIDIVRRLEALNGSEPSFSPLAPHAIEKLLAGREPDAKAIGVLLGASLSYGECREAIDVLAERFRTGSMPAPFRDDLRRELVNVVNKASLVPDFPNGDLCSVLLAYCGDRDGLDKTRKLAMRTSAGDDQELREHVEELRFRALDALMYLEPPRIARLLVEKILGETSSSGSIAFRGKVLDALDGRDDPELAHVVLKAYASLPAELKPRAIELLTERSAWSKALLTAIEAKRVPASALNVNQLRRLQKNKDPDIAQRVKTLFGTIRDRRNPHRERIVDQTKKLIRSMPGDPFAGRAVFNKLCAQCHKIHGEGQEVGPDITSSGRNDFDQLLSNVFDPSLVIGPGYQATTVSTADGRVLTGLLAEDGKDRVVLKIQGGKIETIPRGQIDEMKTSDLSLMPEEMEKQFTPQEIADLFAFLCLDKPPSDPTAKPLTGAGTIEPRRPRN
jgi:putative membrane-bound dehydrogenase-like protein